MTVLPQTPPLNRSEIFDTAKVADRNDPAFSPPTTPEGKTAEPEGEFWRTLCRIELISGINRLAGIKPIQPSFMPSDADIPDNYVTATIQKQKYLPPVTWSNLIYNIQWISFLAITVTPSIAIYGMFTTGFNMKTAIWR